MSFLSLDTNLESSSAWNAFLAHFNPKEYLQNCPDNESMVLSGCARQIEKYLVQYVETTIKSS